MEQERVSSKKGPQHQLGLWALGLFSLIPLGAILVFTGFMNERKPALRAPEATSSRESSTTSRAREPGEEVTQRQPRLRPKSTAGIERTSSKNGVTDDGTSELSPAAEEDAARLARFDENARSFDERLTAFDRERGRPDPVSSASVEGGLKAALQALHPEIRVLASCTDTVCVVELSSPEPVGTMIARVSPWIRTHTRAAIGDPSDTSDESSLRLAFDKSDALTDFRTAGRNLL